MNRVTAAETSGLGGTMFISKINLRLIFKTQPVLDTCKQGNYV